MLQFIFVVICCYLEKKTAADSAEFSKQPASDIIFKQFGSDDFAKCSGLHSFCFAPPVSASLQRGSCDPLVPEGCMVERENGYHLCV